MPPHRLSLGMIKTLMQVGTIPLLGDVTGLFWDFYLMHKDNAGRQGADVFVNR